MERYQPQYPQYPRPPPPRKSNMLPIMIGGTILVVIILILVFIFSDSETTSDTSSDTSSKSTSTPSIPSVDCVGEWEKDCSQPCGDGTQKYKITTIAKGDGKSCPEKDGASKTCKIKDCVCIYTWGCGNGLAKCWDGGLGCRNDCYRVCY